MWLRSGGSSLHGVLECGLSASWVLFCIGNCFHQTVMIASKKLGHPYLLFARANCVRTVSICMCWLFFICRNENINGVGTTGLDFLCLI
jgi:hypothetical protein